MKKHEGQNGETEGQNGETGRIKWRNMKDRMEKQEGQNEET